MAMGALISISVISVPATLLILFLMLIFLSSELIIV